MQISIRWTIGWTSSKELAVETEDAEENLCGTQGENHSDPRVEEPVRNARVRFFWGWSLIFHEMISREGTF